MLQAVPERLSLLFAVIHLVRCDLVVLMTARGGYPDGKLVRWLWLERALCLMKGETVRLVLKLW